VRKHACDIMSGGWSRGGGRNKVQQQEQQQKQQQWAAKLQHLRGARVAHQQRPSSTSASSRSQVFDACIHSRTQRLSITDDDDFHDGGVCGSAGYGTGRQLLARPSSPEVVDDYGWMARPSTPDHVTLTSPSTPSLFSMRRLAADTSFSLHSLVHLDLSFNRCGCC
jgi:hypothetical protein